MVFESFDKILKTSVFPNILIKMLTIFINHTVFVAFVFYEHFAWR